MLKFKGQATIVVSGKPVNFKWNMAAVGLLGDIRNKSVTGLAMEMVDPKLSFLADLLYVGYNSANQNSGKNREYGYDLLEEIGAPKAIELMALAFAVPEEEVEESKKDQAPSQEPSGQ